MYLVIEPAPMPPRGTPWFGVALLFENTSIKGSRPALFSSDMYRHNRYAIPANLSPSLQERVISMLLNTCIVHSKSYHMETENS